MYETDKVMSELPGVKVIEVFEILFYIRMLSLIQFFVNMSLQTQNQFYRTTNTASDKVYYSKSTCSLFSKMFWMSLAMTVSGLLKISPTCLLTLWQRAAVSSNTSFLK